MRNYEPVNLRNYDVTMANCHYKTMFLQLQNGNFLLQPTVLVCYERVTKLQRIVLPFKVCLSFGNFKYLKASFQP